MKFACYIFWRVIMNISKLLFCVSIFFISSHLYAQKQEFVDFKGYEKSYVVIINGDDNEEGHRNNVIRAKETLEEIGFLSERIVIIDAYFKDKKEFENNKVFCNSRACLKEALDTVNNLVTSKDSIFYYITGHGGKEDDGCFVVSDGCVSINDFILLVSFMKEKKIRGIFMFDHCYSGIFPHRLIDAGFDGQAMAPVVEGKESQCQFFIPIFFDALKSKVDFDNDGYIRIAEAFRFAMERYKKETGQEGVIRESIPELHEENLIFVQEKTSKPFIIEITATWCSWCEKMEPELNRIRTLYFDAVEIYKLTTDTNHQAKEILKAMNIEVEGLPTLLFVKRLKKPAVYSGYKDTHEIAALIEKEFGKLIDSQTINEEIRRVYLPEYKGKEIANGRFTIWDIIELKKQNITIEVAKTYDQRFSGSDIAYLVAMKVSPKIAKTYDQRFSGDGIARLVKAKVSPKVAKTYDQRFSGYGIAYLVESKVSPEVANKNDYKDLSVPEIIRAINKSQK